MAKNDLITEHVLYGLYQARAVLIKMDALNEDTFKRWTAKIRHDGFIEEWCRIYLTRPISKRTTMRQAWIDALNVAIKDLKKNPDLPVTKG